MWSLDDLEIRVSKRNTCLLTHNVTQPDVFDLSEMSGYAGGRAKNGVWAFPRGDANLRKPTCLRTADPSAGEIHRGAAKIPAGLFLLRP